MNIAFMAGLNPKGPASKNSVDTGVVSQGRDCKRAGNKTNDFLQVFEKSKLEVKSDTVKNAGSRAGKNESDSLSKTRAAELSKVDNQLSEDYDSTDVSRANGELPEQINSQLLLELANLLKTIGFTPGEVNTASDDAQIQNSSGQSGGKPELLLTTQQKAHIMQLLQMVGKLTGETDGSGKAGFEAVLQNLLKMTEVQPTDENARIDTRYIAEILETLKNDLKSLNQETSANTVKATGIVNAANRGDITGGILTQHKTVESETIKNGSSASAVSGTAVETGKQPLSVDSNQNKEHIDSGSMLKNGQNDLSQSKSSEQKDFGLLKKDESGKTLNVPGLNERTAAQPFELETQVSGSGLDVQNPAGLEQSSEAAKTTRNIFAQIAQKAKLMVAPGVTEMQIQLKPEVLGKLNLTISSENGQVTAKFNAESHIVKAIIEANLGSLKDALTQQGVKVDQLIVDVGTQTHQQGFDRRNSYYSGSGSGKNGSVSVNSDEVDKLFFHDAHSGAVSAYYGSTVEFTA